MKIFDIKFATPQGLFNYFKRFIDQANDQQELDLARQALIKHAKETNDNAMLTAIAKTSEYMETRYADLPRKNTGFCTELFANGLFCLIGSLIILVTIINPAFLILLGPAYILVGLSIGFTLKTMMQYTSTKEVFKQNTELSKFLLSFCVLAEIMFYNFSELSEVGTQSLLATNALGIAALCLAATTIVLSIFVLFLAVQSYSKYSSYKATKEEFENKLNLDERMINISELKAGKIDKLLALAQKKGITLSQETMNQNKEKLTSALQSIVNNSKDNTNTYIDTLNTVFGNEGAEDIIKSIKNKLAFEDFKNSFPDDSDFFKTHFKYSHDLFAFENQDKNLLKVINNQALDIDFAKIILLMKIIAGNPESQDKANDQSYLDSLFSQINTKDLPHKTSKELSEYCLQQIKTILTDETGYLTGDALKLYTIIGLETKLIQGTQPSIKSTQFRVLGDAVLILTSVLFHILIGFSVVGSGLTLPLLFIGIASLIFFSFNEFKDVKRSYFILGMITTTVASIAMTIIFAVIIAGITLNPITLGALGALIIGVAIGATLYKKYWLEPSQQKLHQDLSNAIAQMDNLGDAITQDTQKFVITPDSDAEHHTLSSSLTNSNTPSSNEDPITTLNESRKSKPPVDDDDSEGEGEGEDNTTNETDSESGSDHPHV